MELYQKLLAGYLILFVVVFSVAPFIPGDAREYLAIFGSLMVCLAIILGIYTYIYKKNKKKKNS